MLIVASTLLMNGGTTFIIRLCRELKKTNSNVAVLLLAESLDADLLSQLQAIVPVYYLSDYLYFKFKKGRHTQLGIFMPFKHQKLIDLITRHGKNIHVMGFFGVFFAQKLLSKLKNDIKVSVGVYHQNEFMYEKVYFSFSKSVLDYFKLIPCENFVFYNEATRDYYSDFFKKDYSLASLLPIGIELPDLQGQKTIGSPASQRIVSIGNLVPFKTYNLHIIKLLPILLQTMPDIKYEIYGHGYFENELRALVSSLSLERVVAFKGKINYSNFQETLKDAFLFVGSGTAIIEAAALGIPSIVGIESLSEPVTYGFLSDIVGFSYNENDPNRKKIPILDKILFISHEDNWWHISNLCKKKSREFDVKYTAIGFKELSMKLGSFHYAQMSNYKKIYNFISFLFCALLDLTCLNKQFSSRRNQGSISLK